MGLCPPFPPPSPRGINYEWDAHITCPRTTPSTLLGKTLMPLEGNPTDKLACDRHAPCDGLFVFRGPGIVETCLCGVPWSQSGCRCTVRWATGTLQSLTLACLASAHVHVVAHASIPHHPPSTCRARAAHAPAVLCPDAGYDAIAGPGRVHQPVGDGRCHMVSGLYDHHKAVPQVRVKGIRVRC